MHELHELKDRLIKELEGYGKGMDLSASSLDVIDKLAHTVKNLCKIIDEEGYSEYYPDYPERSHRGRDGMGRYSRGRDMVDELRDLMKDARDERTRQEFQRLINKIENA